MSSSRPPPCAACKFLRRKCTPDCVFAPYFPQHQPMKFITIHKVYGASNVARLLKEIPPSERAATANSLAYEANARLKDPIYGCVRFVSLLQKRLKQVEVDLVNAKQELITHQLQELGGQQVMPSNMQPGHPQGPGNNAQLQQQLLYQAQLQQQLLYQAQRQQQVYDAHQQQQLDEAAKEQDMLKIFELQQQQYQYQQLLQQQQQSMDMLRINRGFDGFAGPSGQVDTSGFTYLTDQAAAMTLGVNSGFDDAGPSGQVNTVGFTQLTGPAAAMTPSLASGGLYEHQLLVQQQQEHHHHQLLVQQHQQQQQEEHHLHQLLTQQQQEQQERDHHYQLLVQQHQQQHEQQEQHHHHQLLVQQQHEQQEQHHHHQQLLVQQQQQEQHHQLLVQEHQQQHEQQEQNHHYHHQQQQLQPLKPHQLLDQQPQPSLPEPQSQPETQQPHGDSGEDSCDAGSSTSKIY